MHHPQRVTLLDLDNDRNEAAETANQAEDEANAYAERVLFPKSARLRIAAAKTKKELLFLAAELNLGVAIVAGQHGHLSGDWRTGGSLRASLNDGDLEQLESLCRISAPSE